MDHSIDGTVGFEKGGNKYTSVIWDSLQARISYSVLNTDANAINTKMIGAVVAAILVRIMLETNLVVSP